MMTVETLKGKSLESIGLNPETDRKGNTVVRPTQEQFLDVFKWIVDNHQYLVVEWYYDTEDRWQPLLVDAQSANRVVTLYNALSDKNKAKMAAMEFWLIIDFAIKAPF